LRRYNKAAQFIEIMRVVIGRSFCREYLLAHKDVREVPSTAADLEPFYAWLRDQVDDEAFSLIAEVMVGSTRVTVFYSEMTKKWGASLYTRTRLSLWVSLTVK
jgi:hypothetical protein